MGRGSPRRGSRNIDKRQKGNDINRAHRNPQPKIPLRKSIQHIYENPEILRSMIFSTVSCLQSDNGVSTSNGPPARNIVMIYSDYYIKICISKYQNTTEFFFTQIWKIKQKCCICNNSQMHSLFLQKHSWPLNRKHYSVFSIDRFESYSFNPDKYRSENKPKKHIKNRKSENQTLSEREITSNSSLSPGEIQTPSQVTPWWESQHAGTATLRG